MVRPSPLGRQPTTGRIVPRHRIPKLRLLAADAEGALGLARAGDEVDVGLVAAAMRVVPRPLEVGQDALGLQHAVDTLWDDLPSAASGRSVRADARAPESSAASWPTSSSHAG